MLILSACKNQHLVRRQEHLSFEKAHKNTLFLHYLFCQIISHKHQGKTDSTSLSEVLMLFMDLGVGVFSCTVTDHQEITYQKAIYKKLKSEAFNAIRVFGTETSTHTHNNNKIKITKHKQPATTKTGKKNPTNT